MPDGRAQNCRRLSRCFYAFTGGFSGTAQHHLCALCRLSSLLLLPHRVGCGSELLLILVDAAQPPGSVLGLPLPFLKIPALLLCCTAFLFLPCSRLRARLACIWMHPLEGIRFVMHLVLRRASVRFALTGKRFSDSIPGLPQSKGRAILQQCFPLPDALFLHLLRGSIASFRVRFRGRQYPLFAFQPCLSGHRFGHGAGRLFFGQAPAGFLLDFFMFVLFHGITCFTKLCYRQK